MDAIELRGLRVMGTHGVSPSEQMRPQPFEVDLDIELDLAAAGASDDLAETLDYAASVDDAVRVVTREHHQLLERIAQRIADEILVDPRVTRVTVWVRKLSPPVPADLNTAGVKITRP